MSHCEPQNEEASIWRLSLPQLTADVKSRVPTYSLSPHKLNGRFVTKLEPAQAQPCMAQDAVLLSSACGSESTNGGCVEVELQQPETDRKQLLTHLKAAIEAECAKVSLHVADLDRTGTSFTFTTLSLDPCKKPPCKLADVPLERMVFVQPPRAETPPIPGPLVSLTQHSPTLPLMPLTVATHSAVALPLPQQNLLGLNWDTAGAREPFPDLLLDGHETVSNTGHQHSSQTSHAPKRKRQTPEGAATIDAAASPDRHTMGCQRPMPSQQLAHRPTGGNVITDLDSLAGRLEKVELNTSRLSIYQSVLGERVTHLEAQVGHCSKKQP